MKVKQGNRGDMRKIHVVRQFFEASGPQGLFFKKKKKQGNRGDMRKMHVTRQFFEASSRNGDLIEKNEKPVFS